MLLEGMVIAGLAVGATEGYVYLRRVSGRAAHVRQSHRARARPAGSAPTCSAAAAFDVHLRIGAGAYICGEETAMLESLEGKRGMVRPKPPLPAHRGPVRQADGHQQRDDARRGAVDPRSTGRRYAATTASAAQQGHAAVPARRQRPARRPRRGAVRHHAARTALRLRRRHALSGRPIRAVQVGGPLGAYLPASQVRHAARLRSVRAAGGMVGHGGIVVFDDTVDMAAMARYAMEFCAVESCGKCTPCRIGSTRGVEVIDKIRAGERRSRTRCCATCATR
jgi:formate dehydrogenase iron-sulfur subunit